MRVRKGISHNLPRTSPPSTRTLRSWRQHLPLNRVQKPELWSKGSLETVTALSQKTGSEELVFPQILKFKPISQILEFWLINTNGRAMNQKDLGSLRYGRIPWQSISEAQAQWNTRGREHPPASMGTYPISSQAQLTKSHSKTARPL